MTGPEHYAEAERLLALAAREVSQNMESTTGERKADVLAAAQVHATLAQTAAIALQTAALPPDGNTAGQWRSTIAAPRKAVGPDPAA